MAVPAILAVLAPLTLPEPASQRKPLCKTELEQKKGSKPSVTSGAYHTFYVMCIYILYYTSHMLPRTIYASKYFVFVYPTPYTGAQNCAVSSVIGAARALTPKCPDLQQPLSLGPQTLGVARDVFLPTS